MCCQIVSISWHFRQDCAAKSYSNYPLLLSHLQLRYWLESFSLFRIKGLNGWTSRRHPNTALNKTSEAKSTFEFFLVRSFSEFTEFSKRKSPIIFHNLQKSSLVFFQSREFLHWPMKKTILVKTSKYKLCFTQIILFNEISEFSENVYTGKTRLKYLVKMLWNINFTSKHCKVWKILVQINCNLMIIRTWFASFY